MNDLTEFLRGRIAEDEAAARTASIGSVAWRLDDLDESVLWWPPERESVIEFERSHGLPLSDGWRGETIEVAGSKIAPHIARHDPARVLAECEAKRRIIGEHELYGYWGLDQYGRWLPHEGDPKFYYCGTCGQDDGIIGDTGPCLTLRALAAVYADHPDYRDEWRP